MTICQNNQLSTLTEHQIILSFRKITSMSLKGEQRYVKLPSNEKGNRMKSEIAIANLLEALKALNHDGRFTQLFVQSAQLGAGLAIVRSGLRSSGLESRHCEATTQAAAFIALGYYAPILFESNHFPIQATLVSVKAFIICQLSETNRYLDTLILLMSACNINNALEEICGFGFSSVFQPAKLAPDMSCISLSPHLPWIVLYMSIEQPSAVFKQAHLILLGISLSTAAHTISTSSAKDQHLRDLLMYIPIALLVTASTAAITQTLIDTTKTPLSNALRATGLWIRRKDQDLAGQKNLLAAPPQPPAPH